MGQWADVERSRVRQVISNRPIVDDHVVGNMKDIRHPLMGKSFLPVQHSPEKLHPLPGRFRSIDNGNLVLALGRPQAEGECDSIPATGALTPFTYGDNGLDDAGLVLISETSIVHCVGIAVPVHVTGKRCRNALAAVAASSGRFYKLECEHEENVPSAVTWWEPHVHHYRAAAMYTPLRMSFGDTERDR
jgi:hypothetical protein